MRWGDMDALGHLNNTGYFRFIEEARIHWLAEHGFDLAGAMPSGPILAATSAQYRKPLVYPCSIRVETVITQVGTSSFTLSHRVCNDAQPERTAAECEAVIVWCDYAAGKPIPLPTDLRAHLIKAQQS